LSAAWLK